MERIRILVPGEPVPLARARFSGRHCYQPKRNVDYRAVVQEAARSAMGGRKPLAGEVSATVKLYRRFKTTARNFGDVDNHLKALLDALNGTAFEDDRQVVRCLVEKFQDAKHPRAEIVLETFPPQAGEWKEWEAVKLNPKQEQFCCEYARSGNAGGSYQKIYGTRSSATAATNANRLLKNADIQSRLKEIQDELASERIMDVREIQERLTAIGRGEVSEETITPKGERIRKQASIRDMLKALEILAKCKGMFVAQVDVKATIPVVIAGADCLVD